MQRSNVCRAVGAVLFPVVGVLTVALLTSATSAGAEDEATRPGPRARRAQVLADYLGLTDEQKASWRSLHEQHRQEMTPLQDAVREQRRRVREAVEAPNPDPAAVGQTVLALRARQKDLRAAREAFEARLSSLLNAEQKGKLEALKAARRLDRGGLRGGRHGARGAGARAPRPVGPELSPGPGN